MNVRAMKERTSIRPRREQSHRTAAPPIAVGDWREDMGMVCIVSPAMMCEVTMPHDMSGSPDGEREKD